MNKSEVEKPQDQQSTNIPSRKITVFLSDLTHTGQLVASNVHPYGIGLIASYMKANLNENLEIDIFKYPDDLAAAVNDREPTIVGFANYSWNCNLSYEFACRIKERYPKTIIVFGGPNYGLSEREQHDFWNRYPKMDFYVLKEGERAMVELVRSLENFDYDVEALKKDGCRVPSCHYFHEGEFVAGELLPRIKDLNEIPSPYSTGLMDKFFDDILIPLTCNTRGCPFSCTFCTEGVKYYQKVVRRHGLGEDLNYIAERVGKVQDIILADANFGMFPEDIECAKAIAEIQKTHGWPKHVHVSGGKNQKTRLLQVAEILDGAMNVAASLQSTDEGVLKNVKRSNISLEELNFVGSSGTKIDANTYTELILNLPGDTFEKHAKSLRDSVNAGLAFLRLYQLIMLLETDLNTPESRERFGMQTKFRVMPRCFGTYQLFGKEFPCVEAEEICVAQDSLPFEDYIRCRELDLTVEIAHNVNIFRELFGVCQHFNLSWFDFLLRFFNRRREYGPALTDLFNTFVEDTVKPLWDTREELLEFASKNLNRYILDELGTNELFKGKAVAFFRLQEEMHDALFGEMSSLLEEKGYLTEAWDQYLRQLKNFSRYRKIDLLEGKAEFKATFDFDFKAILGEDYTVDPEKYRYSKSVEYVFFHNEEQRDMIDTYVHQYGTTTLGLGRILMRAHVKRLFRNFRVEGETIEKGFEGTYRRALNLYGD